jgi:Domain of unknown function (DUF6542)
MTTSSQWAPLEERGGDIEFDLLVDESASTGATEWDPHAGGVPPGLDAHGATRADVTEAAHEPSGAGSTTATEYAATGTPGRSVIASTVLATAAAAVLDLALVGRLSFFFDVSFVVICLVAAMAVRSRDLFTAAVLPPLAFAAVIGGMAAFRPEAIGVGSGLAETFLAGLAAHAVGLVGGYAGALLTVAARAYARRHA